MRSAADGSGAIGATEPLAAVGMLLPSGVTNGSGGGPSHGAEHARLVAQLPQRRGPGRAPGPARHPGTVRLYGQTRPMRTAATVPAASASGTVDP